MRRNKLQLYLHLVWATWDRLPLILPAWERRLYREIEAEARGMGCLVLALNGMVDHVHLVVSMPSTVSVADLAKQVKGVSSRFINQVLAPETEFRWQGAYGAFTAGADGLDALVQYVKNQARHHAEQTLWPEWEETYGEIPAIRAGT